jgi:hypothetical protein
MNCSRFLRWGGFLSLLVAPTALSAQTAVNQILVSTEFTNRFYQPVLHDGEVAFLGGFSSPTHIFLTDGSGPRAILDGQTAFPPDTSAKFTAYAWLTSDGETLFFTGNSGNEFNGINGGNYGLFSYDGSAITTLVTDASSLTSATGLATITGIQAGGGTVVFTAQQSGETDAENYFAFYAHDGNTATLIAETGTTVSEGDGALTQLVNTINISPNGEHIAFWAGTKFQGSIASESALYRYTGSGLETILLSNSQTNTGSTLSGLAERAPLVLNDGSVVTYGFADGNQVAVMVSPDNTITQIPYPSIEGQTMSGLQFTATDGEKLYGVVRGYDQTFTTFYTGVVWSEAAGIEIFLEFPFTADEVSWGSYSFAFYDANADGALFSLYAEDFSVNGVFTNIDGLGVALNGNGNTTTSYWSEYQTYGNWKWSLALGWIYDDRFPFVYASYTFGSWIYVVPDTGSLDGFYLYNYGDASWYYVVEGFNGWVYQLTGDNIGWRFLFEG